jgi:hypothetical protein
MNSEAEANQNFCPKCGCHWVTHNDDGSCVVDEDKEPDSDPKAAVRTVTLTNFDRPEYGGIVVDLNLLARQITWLAGLGISSPEKDGILNLLEGIQDLADPVESEEE